MTFDDLVAPIGTDRFLSDYWGQRPVHLPAQSGRTRPGMVAWSRLNELLQQRAHWDAAHLKLVMNSRGVGEEHYIDDVVRLGSTRRLANPAKVDTLLAMGASLVANEVQDAAPEIRALTDMLGRTFSARVGGNIYASFKGVQAFASHCDTHEVFAIQGEGEKRWRLYTNRADNPTEALEGADAQAMIDRAKGPVMMDVTLKPGDVLYIPRGWFHDAVASAAASLHLTIGVLPHTAAVLFDLLRDAAKADPLFRAYLPDARVEGGVALGWHLDALAERLMGIIASPAFRTAVAVEQRRAIDPGHAPMLPDRPALEFYARTERGFDIVVTTEGALLRSASGQHQLEAMGDVARYMLERPAVSVGELAARFAHHEQSAITAMVTTVERLGLIRRYQPDMG